MYTKHLRTETNATSCRIKMQVNSFYCEMHDLVNMDIEQLHFICHLDLNHEPCKQASEGKSLTIFDQKLTFEKRKQEVHHTGYRNANEDFVNACEVYEWSKKDNFESHIQDIQDIGESVRVGKVLLCQQKP